MGDNGKNQTYFVNMADLDSTTTDITYFYREKEQVLAANRSDNRSSSPRPQMRNVRPCDIPHAYGVNISIRPGCRTEAKLI